MNLELHDFRLAREILEHRDAWHELKAALESIQDQHIIEKHRELGGLERGPAGGQTSINKVVHSRLVELEWTPEPALFDADDGDMRGWKMDFVKARIGVEIAFNHAEAVPWNFTRLNLAGEASQVIEASRIEVGVAAFATKRLKQWCKMDSAVGTFELACAWLELMRPIMPIPILVVGLDCEGWQPTYEFRGTGRRPPHRG